jgi:hypothetical protein
MVWFEVIAELQIYDVNWLIDVLCPWNVSQINIRPYCRTGTPRNALSEDIIRLSSYEFVVSRQMKQ